jgi:hypothetical protein
MKENECKSLLGTGARIFHLTIYTWTHAVEARRFGVRKPLGLSLGLPFETT